MTKTKLTKIIIDILVYSDFIFLMSHGTVRNLTNHAYAGMALFTLFLVHHILNGCFYKTVTSGDGNSTPATPENIISLSKRKFGFDNETTDIIRANAF